MSNLFSYPARTVQGEPVEGTLVADHLDGAAQLLFQRKLFIVYLAPLPWWQQWRFSLCRSVGKRQLASFCHQLAAMLDAGLPLADGLAVISRQAEQPVWQWVTEQILAAVRAGEALSAAMARFPATFPALMVHTVAAGEAAGAMDTVLRRLAAHYEKEYRLESKIAAALIYPAVVIMVTACLVIFLVTFVFPVFVSVFPSLGINLPPATRLLFTVGVWLGNNLGVLGGGFLLALFLGGQVVRSPRARPWLDFILFRVPVYGAFVREICIARFSRTLATLLRGGVPILTALDTVRGTADNVALATAASRIQAAIRAGAGFAAPLRSMSVFPPMVIQMAAVGEETGRLDEMLEKVADYYEAAVDDRIMRLSSLIEPALILVLGAIVGGIALAVLWPLFRLTGAVW